MDGGRFCDVTCGGGGAASAPGVRSWVGIGSVMTTFAAAGVLERSIAWLVAKRHRRVRHRGLARNRPGLSLQVAASTCAG